jgi:hypothetical protein
MNLRLANQLLAELRTRELVAATPERAMAIRLAARWLLQASSAETDLTIRLQVLEGAAGQPWGTWSLRPRASLPAAKAAFSDAANTMDAAWLSPEDSGMYAQLLRSASASIKKFRVSHLEPGDVINSLLYGLNVFMEPQPVKPVYETGKYASKVIKSGGETPRRMAASQLAKWMDRNVGYKEKKHVQEQQAPVNDEGDSVDLEPGMHGAHELTTPEVIEALYYGNMGNPLSSTLKVLMDATWRGNEQMQWFLQGLLAGNPPNQKEIAEHFDKHAPVVNRTYLAQWKKFYQELFSRRELTTAIEQWARSQGLDWEMKIPTDEELNEVFPGRSDRRVATDLLQWLFGRTTL